MDRHDAPKEDEVQPANAPVFIVGCPRSGTTLLQRMLDAHPDVAIAPETFFVRRFWQRRADYGDLARDETFARLLDDVTAMPAFAEMDLDAEAFVQTAMQGERTCAAVFRQLLQQFARKRGVRVVGEKTPNHVLYLPTLYEFFPEARFIHVVRDARAVVNSWRSVPWASGRRWRDAEVWVEYVAAGRAAESWLGASLYAVRFERLVQAPESVLRRLCQMLELAFDPAMLAFHEQAPQVVNVEREPWKTNVTKPIDSSVAGRWRQQLRPGEVAEVEAVAADEMRNWGYAPESAAWQRAVIRATLPMRRLMWKLTLVSKQRSGAA